MEEFKAASDDDRDDPCPPVVAMLMLRIISASSRPSLVARLRPLRPCAAANLAEVIMLEPSILTVAACFWWCATTTLPPPPTATDVAVGATVVGVPDADPPKARQTGIGEVTGNRVIGHVSELEELDPRYCVRTVVTIGGIVIYHLVATGVGSRYRVVGIVSVEYGVVSPPPPAIVSLPALPSITFAALFPVNWSAPRYRLCSLW